MPRLFQAGTVFFDLQGQILAGGSLTVYDNRTTTLATIYTDADRTTASANPLTLGSDGRLPNSIFVSGASTYTTLSKTALGATVTSYNDVGALSATLPRFDVRDYGAEVDGTTNDRDAVQAAFDAANAAGGGLVYFPPGTTYIDRSASAQIDGYAGVGMIGDGWTSIVKSSGANRTIEWQDAACEDVTIRDLCFDANSGSDFDSVVSFDEFASGAGAGGILVTGCKFINSGKAAAASNNWTITALSFRGVSNVVVTGNVGDGVQFKLGGGTSSSAAENNIVCTDNILVDSNAYGISTATNDGGSMSNCRIAGNIIINPQRGAMFTGCDGSSVTNATISNFVVEGNIMIAGAATDASSNFFFKHEPGAASSTESGLIFANNYIDVSAAGATVGNAIRVNGCTNSMVTGNTVIDDGAALSAAAISAVNAVDCTIAENKVFKTQQAVDADGATFVIRDNRFDGDGTDGCIVTMNAETANCTGSMRGNTFVDCLNSTGFNDKPISIKASTGFTATVKVVGNEILGSSTAYAVDENDDSGTFAVLYKDNDFEACTTGAFRRRATSFEDAGLKHSGNIGTGFVTQAVGTASDTTDGNGNITIAHGLSLTSGEEPKVQLTMQGDNAYRANVQAADNTNITVLVTDAAGADVASTAVVVGWSAVA